MNLGELIDDLYTKRAMRLEAQKKTDEAAAIEAVAKTALIEHLQVIGLSKASGSLATASIKSVTIPKVQDWTEIHNWIRVNDRFDMLHKRISEVAWRETLEAGILVPGTEPQDDIKLSLTKASR